MVSRWLPGEGPLGEPLASQKTVGRWGMLDTPTSSPGTVQTALRPRGTLASKAFSGEPSIEEGRGVITLGGSGVLGREGW